MSKHTSEKWEIIDFIRIVNQKGTPIARSCTKKNAKQIVKDHNEKTELLEALKRIQNKISANLDGTHTTDDTYEVINFISTVAEEQISKAREQ